MVVQLVRTPACHPDDVGTGSSSNSAEMKYYVYIIQSQKDQSYYIGYTQGLEKRLMDHNRGRGRYSSRKSPWNLVYSEEVNTKKEAIIREKRIKRWKSKRYIDRLISESKSRGGSSVG